MTTKDSWLNDGITYTAQKLVFKALGKIDSYQSVLNSEKKRNYPFRAVNNEHIKLLHDGNNHWLLSFSSSDRVQICDSLKSHTGRITLRIVNALYQNLNDTTSGKLSLSFLPVQKQEDRLNWSSFAIAYAAEILDARSTFSKSKIKHEHFDLKFACNFVLFCFGFRIKKPSFFFALYIFVIIYLKTVTIFYRISWVSQWVMKNKNITNDKNNENMFRTAFICTLKVENFAGTKFRGSKKNREISMFRGY